MPPNAAATESWKNRSGSSSLETRVCVCDVDDAGENQHPGRIDHVLGACREPIERGLDRRDPAAVGRQVSAPRSARRDDGAAANE